MADEESTQPLVGEDVAEAPEAAPAPNAKLNLLDIYHIVQELNFLRGGGGWTGTLGESITRSLLSTTCGFPAARREPMGARRRLHAVPALTAGRAPPSDRCRWEGGGAILASVVGVVLISLSMALDLYMVHLGLKYYGDSRVRARACGVRAPERSRSPALAPVFRSANTRWTTSSRTWASSASSASRSAL